MPGTPSSTPGAESAPRNGLLGPALAALAATITGLPGLGLPFLSDDWGHLAAAFEGALWPTPYGYFRPLCALTYSIDWQLWGLAAAPYRVVNVLLAALTAWLVVVLIRRYTHDAALAGMAGILFGLHPYHIEDVAWIAARSDLLSSFLFLLAALAYDRWRAQSRGLAFVPALWLQAALLAKESAVVFPAFLLVLGVFDRARRPRQREWIRGYLPLFAVTAFHFLLLRPLALEGLSLNALQWIGAWKRNLLFYSSAAMLPAQTEFLEARPVVWWLAGLVLAAGLLVAAKSVSGRVPRVIWPAAATFVVLLGPSLISFQQRFFLLPCAASALALAALLRAAGRRIGVTIACMLLIGWSASAVEQWRGWYSAGRASERLMDGLIRGAADPETREIVLIAMPHRVHGAPVRADFTTVLPVAGGRPVVVHSATEIDYPTDGSDALMPPRETALQVEPGFAEVHLRIIEDRYTGLVWPLLPDDRGTIQEEWGRIARDDPGSLRVRVDAAPGRAVYAWIEGDLSLLLHP